MYNQPYPYWMPPPMNNGGNIDHNTIEKGIQIALKIASREAREAERIGNRMKKQKDDEKKEAAASRARVLYSIEWFIIGIISYPVVGPLYQLMITRITH